MAGFTGREFVFSWDSTTLVGVRSRTMSITNDYVDVTTDDDSGWRKLLSDPGTRSLEVTIAGITSDEALIGDIMAGTVAGKTLEGTLPTSLTTAGTVSGSFLISSLERTGEHDGACEFSATFMSDGAVTYTASV